MRGASCADLWMPHTPGKGHPLPPIKSEEKGCGEEDIRGLAVGLVLLGQGILGSWVGVWSRRGWSSRWAQPCGPVDLEILHSMQKRAV